MFGFFKKKKPSNALDAAIHIMYGNPPPSKTAIVAESVRLAYENLLFGAVPGHEVVALTLELDDGPMPYSTHDLAVSVALAFFNQPARIGQLEEVQLAARKQLLGWILEKKVNPLLAETFENKLYKLGYRLGDVGLVRPGSGHHVTVTPRRARSLQPEDGIGATCERAAVSAK